MGEYDSYFDINRYGPNGQYPVPPTQHDPSDTPVEGAQNPRAYTAFTSSDGKFTANVWECDPGTLEIKDLAIDEAIFIIDGEVHLTDKAGKTTIFRAGEGYVIPKGFTGTMYMPYPLRKYNCIYER